MLRASSKGSGLRFMVALGMEASCFQGLWACRVHALGIPWHTLSGARRVLRTFVDEVSGPEEEPSCTYRSHSPWVSSDAWWDCVI